MSSKGGEAFYVDMGAKSKPPAKPPSFLSSSKPPLRSNVRSQSPDSASSKFSRPMLGRRSMEEGERSNDSSELRSGSSKPSLHSKFSEESKSGTEEKTSESNVGIQKYRMGDQVEARRDGGSRWLPAKISWVNSSDSYDLKYSDGTEEKRVAAKYIRSINSSLLPEGKDRRLSGSDEFKKIFEEGDKIEANYRGRGKWCPGKITRDRGDKTYDISYDDGESEMRVNEDMIRAIDKGSDHRKLSLSGHGYREGDKIEANYRGRGKWYPGKITRDRGDKTYDISYDDGESEMRVNEDMIRAIDKGDDHRKLSLSGHGYREGDKIEANYRGRGKWYPGKITRDHGDKTYDISYDDGESEMRVNEDMIRAIDKGDDHRKLLLSGHGYREGDKIEANYRGRGKWYPGKITRDRGDKTYDISYDDGESEMRVNEDMIRAIDKGDDHRKLLLSGHGYREGDKIEANYRGRGKWYPGKITRDRGDKTYDISYDDGESEMRVNEDMIRAIDKGSDHRKLSLSGHGYREGDKIEANYRGRGKWYPGKITRDRGDKTYDISYDDGESEMRVNEDMIRAIDKGGDRRKLSLSGHGYREGDKIEANYRGRGKWYPGKITRDRGDKTYDISYDDGESEMRVNEDMIRAIDKGDDHRKLSLSGHGYREGDKIEANYRGRGKWYPGKITRDRGDKTYDISYDDGESEMRVNEDMIRAIDKGGDHRKLSLSGHGYREGDKIEANYRGRGKWYPGKITRDRGDKTYDISYDDGESEMRVNEDMIRKKELDKVTTRHRLSEGDKIEANYRGRGRWFPGKITRDHGDDTYDISYDDGESEKRVPSDMIKVKDLGHMKASSSKLEEGDKIEANYRGRGKWYPGKITRDRGDKTYDISYDDGESEMRVNEDMIRAIDKGNDHRKLSLSGHGYREGDKIEANYRGRGKWYPGKITRDRGDKTYDISYDDGESEMRVNEDMIRKKELDKVTTRHRLSEGDKIEANYRGRGRWFPGKITRDHGDDTYDISYDDGESEKRVPSDMIKVKDLGHVKASSSKLEEGDKIEANYRGRGKWYPGKITRDRGDKTYDISYDDGESEMRVNEDMIRAIDKGGDHRKLSLSGHGYREGDKIEANYRGRGKWYPGKITRDRGDKTYDISYDDGESEMRVNEDMIRKKELDKVTTRHRLSEGDKIEANYRGRGRWFPGKITRDHGDDTYDISYDDGESEKRVPSDMIKVKDLGHMKASSSKLEEGDKIEANYRGRGKWYPGEITRDHGDDTYDISYDDGESEKRVPSNMIKVKDLGHMKASSSKLEEGDKIEANYRGRGKWYPGKITRDRGDKTYDISYDDGESEMRVNEDMIRKKELDKVTTRHRLSEGDKIEANYRGRGRWFPGKITRDHGDDTYDISYDDGESEKRVPSDMIKVKDLGHMKASSSKLEEGDKIEANYRGRGKWYPGEITRDHGDDTYDISYDDGESEKRVPSNMIKVKDLGHMKASSSKLEEGDKIEANYRGRGKWYPGKITRDRGDKTYDISYDDGESEMRVNEDMIRKKELDKVTTRHRLSEGDKIEANYRGRGRWFPGKITRDHGDDTYDISYDDGESEMRVNEDMIRAIDKGGDHRKLSLSGHGYREGDKIEANYRGRGKWYPGKITRDRGDKTYDISYDDGESEMRVNEDMIRAIDKGGDHRKLSLSGHGYREGDKIEANYRGRGKWYPGKITRDRGDKTYDISYDDGESEMRVNEDMIRAIDKGGDHRKLSLSGHGYREGDKIEANYRGRGKWYPGKITRDRGDKTYDISYDDGESEMRVNEDMIRKKELDKVTTRHRLSEGDKIEANYRGRGRWFPGKITRDHGDDTYDISYDDGESEKRVPSDMIKVKDLGHMKASSSKLEEGDKIEANYRGRGKWYPGKITRDHGDDTYDISYDDGESEKRVPSNMIKVKDLGHMKASSSKLEEGDKIEANYRGRGKWYPGKITRDRGDKTYDISYDDGESEMRVNEDMIRKKELDKVTTRHRLSEGDKIEANYRGRGRWFPGKITRDHGDDTYDISYDDGESEKRVPSDMIKVKDLGHMKASSSKLEEGDKIEANYRGRGKWYPGKITRDRGDKTYDISYDDGESEMRVNEDMIRAIDKGGDHRKLSLSGHGYREGDKIEANYRGRGKWYPGKITRDRGDKTYDISYDDGESEMRVNEDMIRKKELDKVTTRHRLSEGDKIEANYRGRGRWFPGKITRDHGDDTYDISYDDGESEKRVPSDMIKVKDLGHMKASSSKLEEGDKIEANYRGRGKWYPGKITRDRGDKTYDISYDDGESEMRVNEDMIRLQGGFVERDIYDRKTVRTFEVGDKVEANFRGRGKWYPGKITRDRGDDTYDISYDDGEPETKVTKDMIRPIHMEKSMKSHSQSRKHVLPLSFLTSLRSCCINFQKMSVDKSYRLMFADYDSDSNSGLISRKEFKSCLRKVYEYSLKLNTRQSNSRSSQLLDTFEDVFDEDNLQILMDCLVSSKAGTSSLVSYHDLISYVFDIEADEEMIDIHSILKKHLLSKSRQTVADIVKQFSSSKTYSKGFVRVTEFQKIVKKLCSKLTEKQVESLSNAWDLDQEGLIDYYAFVLWIQSGSNLDECKKKFITQMKMLNVSDIDDRLNSAANRSGKISEKDFVDIVLSLGVILNRSTIRAIYSILDPREHGNVTAVDIINMIEKDNGISDHHNDDRRRGSYDNREDKRDRKERGTTLDQSNCLISNRIRDEISGAVLAYLRKPTSLGRLLLDHRDNEKTSSLSKRQFRKFLASLQIQLSDDDEETIFDSLDFRGDDSVAIDDIITFFMEETLKNTSDLYPAYEILKTYFIRKKILSKELNRQLSKADPTESGYIEFQVWEGILKKLCGNTIQSSHLNDLSRYFDPEKDGKIDILYHVGLLSLCSDVNRADIKFKHCMKLMRLKGLTYKDTIRDTTGRDDKTAPMEEVIDAIEKLGLPMLRVEIEHVMNKYQKRGMIRIETLLQAIDNDGGIGNNSNNNNNSTNNNRSSTTDLNGTGMGAGKKGSILGGSTSATALLFGNSDNFGKIVYQKLCLLRSNMEKRMAIRFEIIKKDTDYTGKISKRDLQRILDKHADFTDADVGLLSENLEFLSEIDRNPNDIDYSMLLLLLYEPMQNIPLDAGVDIMSKLSRTSDTMGLKKFLKTFYHNLASFDSSGAGLISSKNAETVFKEDCPNISSNTVRELLRGFQERGSLNNTNIYYPEMLSFLSSCYLWNVLIRIYNLDVNRQRQGLRFKEHLLKLMSKKNKKMDYIKFEDLFQSVGILMSDTAFQLIQLNFGNKSTRVIDIEQFMEALDDASHIDPTREKKFRSASDLEPYRMNYHRKGNRNRSGHNNNDHDDNHNGSSHYNDNNDNEEEEEDEISERILREYDNKVISSVQLAFDIFDNSHHNEIPAIELERVLHSIGIKPSVDDMTDLIAAIDRRNKGFLEFNDFLCEVVPYIRSQYSKGKSLSEKKLKAAFDRIDINGDGELSHAELKYAMQNTATALTDEEVEELVDYLDVDHDGTITWKEFESLYAIIHDDVLFQELNPVVRSAFRKIQYSCLPDPSRYLCMFWGLPVNYRKSVLAEIARTPEFALHNVVCAINPPKDISKDIEYVFNVQLIRVSGAPSEAEERSDDIIERSARFCLCSTDKPPSPSEPGTPPTFLGNVSHVFATVHPQHKDIWEFSNAEELDANKSCFVKCTYSPPEDTKDHSTVTHPQQLYLFIELVTTFRVPKREPKKKKKKVTVVPEKKIVSQQRKKLTETTKSLLANFNFTGSALTGSWQKDKSNSNNNNNAVAGRSSLDRSNALRNSNDMSQRVRRNRFNVNDNEAENNNNNNNNINNNDNDNDNDDNEDDIDDSELYSIDTVELCCGWVMVPIANTLEGTNRKLKIPIYGGTPFGVVHIPKDEVKQRAGAWNALKRAFGVETKSSLSVIITPCLGNSTPTTNPTPPQPSKPITITLPFSQTQKDQTNPNQLTQLPSKEEMLNKMRMISLLPSNIVLPTVVVSAAGIYRVLLYKMKFAYEESQGRVLPQTGSLGHADPILSNFPRLLEDPAASRVLLQLWSNEAPIELKNFINKDILVSQAYTDRSFKSFREVVLRLYRAYHAPGARQDKLNLEDESAEEINKRELKIFQLIGIQNPMTSSVQLGSSIANTVSTTNPPTTGNGYGNGNNASSILSRSLTFRPSTANSTLPGNSGNNNISSTNNNKNSILSRSVSAVPAPKLSQIPLVDHLHTPFNAKELMWKNRSELGLL